ncbi:MAG: dienelactone hydrolase family protein [Erythrobacter sp.]|uniref:dienelactone hydrolase family protein n=1 Tax=Parasphingorhabdus sp. TaxID=2709688 RepID=UPI0032987B68
MCDQAKLQNWAKDALSRREFGALAGAAALTACSSNEMTGSPSEQAEGMGSSATLGDEVGFQTADGIMDARFFAGPDGPAPAVIHWPDIAGIRQSHLEMAQRTANAGYAVLLVNPYYRDAKGEIWPDFVSFADGGWGRASEMRANLSSFAIKRDTQAIVAWLDEQSSVDTFRGIGAEGYCMGGPFTVYSAHAVPGRVKAAASFHGGGLVRDDEESPHRLLPQTTAQYLIAIASDDDASAPDDKVALCKAAAAANSIMTVEVYDGDHGWTVPDSPVYAKEAAERAFAEKLKLYEAAL